MKKILIPLVLLLVGTGAGVGAGLFLGGPADNHAAEGDAHAESGTEMAADGQAAEDGHAAETQEAGTAGADHAAPEAPAEGDEESVNEYVKLKNQFVVPVVESGRVAAMVVLNLNLEVRAGTQEDAFAQEPKIRDAFLQVLFDHANIGGFAGNFTSSSNMRVLRGDLRHAAEEILGERLVDVLIIDIVRQDIQS